MPRHWLMKSEPGDYSIDDLERDGRTHWDGVRNYQAGNLLRDEVQVGDKVLFYHSNADPSGVAGVAEVVRDGYPDFTQFDPDDAHHDPKAREEDPRWFMVDIAFVQKLDRLVPLSELKEEPELEGMLVTKPGQRLSVQPVEPKHFAHVVGMGRRRAP